MTRPRVHPELKNPPASVRAADGEMAELGWHLLVSPHERWQAEVGDKGDNIQVGRSAGLRTAAAICPAVRFAVLRNLGKPFRVYLGRPCGVCYGQHDGCQELIRLLAEAALDRSTAVVAIRADGPGAGRDLSLAKRYRGRVRFDVVIPGKDVEAAERMARLAKDMASEVPTVVMFEDYSQEIDRVVPFLAASGVQAAAVPGFAGQRVEFRQKLAERMAVFSGITVPANVTF